MAMISFGYEKNALLRKMDICEADRIIDWITYTCVVRSDHSENEIIMKKCW